MAQFGESKNLLKNRINFSLQKIHIWTGHPKLPSHILIMTSVSFPSELVFGMNSFSFFLAKHVRKELGKVVSLKNAKATTKVKNSRSTSESILALQVTKLSSRIRISLSLSLSHSHERRRRPRVPT